MKKYTYIKAQLAKTNKKNDENYIITRIWHQLNSENIKFVTQQYVVRPDGKYALTDMYFPQLQLHIEIDEGYHQHELQTLRDTVREKDIISVTNHEIQRVTVSDSLEHIHAQIEDIVSYITYKIDELGDAFIPWDIEKEFSPETYIQKGYIHLKEDVAFRTCADVANVFGHTYKGFQQGGTKHPYRDDVIIWFPKLFPNGDWDNSISPDGMVIRERSTHAAKVAEHIQDIITNGKHKRIVFAKVKGALGDIVYKFKGEFQLDMDASEQERCLVWRRIADVVKTYPAKSRT